MKYKIIFPFFLTICLVITSCKQSNNTLLKEQLDAFIGTDIVIPENLLSFNDKNHIIKKEAKYKVVSYVDSLSCISCYLDESAKGWANLLANFRDGDFSLFIIFQTQDIESIRTLFDSYKLDYPFFIDLYGDFKQRNAAVPSERKFHTFLLKNNSVILVGSPAGSSKMLELYKQEILKK